VPADEPVIQKSKPEDPEQPTANVQNSTPIVDAASVPLPGNRGHRNATQNHISWDGHPQPEAGRGDDHREFSSQKDETSPVEQQAHGKGIGQTTDTSSVQSESTEEVPRDSVREEAEIPLPPSRDDTAAAASHLPRERQSIEMLNRGKALNKRLLKVSEDILRAFLPAEGSSLVHDVCESFWGSVDDIIRVSWSYQSVNYRLLTSVTASDVVEFQQRRA
jgi:hypothetical protein